MANDIALRVAANFQDKVAKRKTFPEARAELLEHLKKEHWTVKEGLKVPHATSPDKLTRLWFKPQAVYVSFTNSSRDNHEFNHARSLWIDIRTMDPHAVEKQVEQRRKVSDEPFPPA